MNFTKFDMMILVTMALAVIGMSFVMPALGLTSADTEASDVPEFSVDRSTFDLAGDFPDSPGTPSSGTLTINNDDVDGSNNVVLLDDNVSLTLIEDSNVSDPDMRVSFFDSGTNTGEDVYFNNSDVGTSRTVSNFGYEVYMELASVENENESNFTWSIDWNLRDQPEDQSWASRIPLVGGIFSAGETLAQTLSWLGSILFWGVQFIVELSLNLVSILAQVSIYLIDTASWLTGTYGEVISSANSWASVFVLVPGILLFAEFAKIVMIGISLLPTT